MYVIRNAHNIANLDIYFLICKSVKTKCGFFLIFVSGTFLYNRYF